MSLKGNRAAVDLFGERERSRFVMTCWAAERVEQKCRGSSLRRLEPRRFRSGREGLGLGETLGDVERFTKAQTFAS